MGEYIQYEKYASMRDYVKSLEDIAEKEKSKKNKILLTSGVFDIIHPGHTTLFKKIKEEYPGILFVNVANDARVRYRKGAHKPVNSSYNRAIVISSLEAVNYVTVHPEEKSSPAWKLTSIIKPDYVIQSWPWTKEERKELESLVSPLPKLIHLPQYYPGKHSSEQIRRIIREKSEEEAILVKIKELLPQFESLLTQKKPEIKLADTGLIQEFTELHKKSQSLDDFLALVSVASKIKRMYGIPFDELDSFLWNLTRGEIPPKNLPPSSDQSSSA
ncbi:MAG: hypothetical protein AABX44_01425 [Nanoarchaeota archaeon]